ncbi:hypothetical protein ACWEN3_05040 [Streptomyces sp. NPDC004561]
MKRISGATAAVATSVVALLGTGAGSAGAADSAHCDRAEQDIWSQGPGREATAHHCSLPSTKRRWYTVEIGTLVQKHHRTDDADSGVDRTVTLHDRTIKCLGYTSTNGTVHWFGCPAPGGDDSR